MNRIEAAYRVGIADFADVLSAGLHDRIPDFEVWRPLAVASADNDLEGLFGSLPRVLAMTVAIATELRRDPVYTLAREVAFVCDVAADLGLLVRLGVIAREP